MILITFDNETIFTEIKLQSEPEYSCKLYSYKKSV